MLALPLARRAVPREDQSEMTGGLLAEAAPGQQTAHPPETEPYRDRQPGHVRALPEREAVVTEQVPRCRARADETPVIRESAVPELRPREAVPLAGDADPLRRIPQTVVVGVAALGLRQLQVHL